MMAERNWPWKRLWMKLLLLFMWLASVSAATSSSERPVLSCMEGGGKEGGKKEGGREGRRGGRKGRKEEEREEGKEGGREGRREEERGGGRKGGGREGRREEGRGEGGRGERKREIVNNGRRHTIRHNTLLNQETTGSGACPVR